MLSQILGYLVVIAVVAVPAVAVLSVYRERLTRPTGASRVNSNRRTETDA